MHKTLLILLFTVWPVFALAQDHYLVRFEEKLEKVSVKACFEGSLPTRLYHNTEASRFAGRLITPTGKLRLRSNSGSTRLPVLKPDSCLSWQVDLARATGQTDFRFASRVGNDIVTDGDLWFWRGPGDRKVQVEVVLPSGMNISVPWRQISHSGKNMIFKPAGTPASWVSRIAVGSFPIRTLNVGETGIRLAIPGSAPDARKEKLVIWVKQAVAAVAGVYGRFPQASPQLIVIPIGSRNEPVPWAHVMRGGGVSAEFFVDETRPLEELAQDWTACHELSHMLLPFVSSRDRWLSEGLASYYQYILLARSGMLSEEQAWQGMFDGIKRGERGTPSGSRGGTLAEATREG